MRPKQQQKARHDDLFRARLDQIINMKHALVVLADKIDWAWLDKQLADCFSDKGRPAEPVRFMIGMFLLKHTYTLSDEQVWDRWVHDPYFQYFTGEEFFQHTLSHERSSMSHWRKRIGDRLDILLQMSLRIAHDTGALKKSDLARVTVDTTVQPKNITFPTDAKLLEVAIRQLGKLAREENVPLRQSYARVAKRAALMAGRYAHAKQFKRMRRQLKFLRTRLGRIMRDIRRKIDGDQDLEEAFAVPLIRAAQIRGQKQRQRGWKLYSWHAPETECIGKGKVRTPYEFGVKVSLTTTNSRCKGGQFILHAKALPGNPYDGHTLKAVIEETEALTGREIKRAYVDKGYRGHDAPKPHRVFKSGQKRGVHGQIKRELRGRSAIEAVIGHCKTDGHLDRNFLKGHLGDRINAVMSAVGYNLRLILNWLRKLLRQIIAAIEAAIIPPSIFEILEPAS
jgi:IS5 family transposase|tara:strand:+ start:168 stop:1523 length:1356 start_codon:yes stop_codon:yes gene_type:complete